MPRVLMKLSVTDLQLILIYKGKFKLSHNVNIGSLIICDDKWFLSNELCIVYPRGDKEQATS